VVLFWFDVGWLVSESWLEDVWEGWEVDVDVVEERSEGIAEVADHETALMCLSMKQAGELQSVILVSDPFACM
jgi:hypothetical protein